METLFIGSTRRGWLALQALHEAGARLVGVIGLAQANHETENYENRIEQWSVERGIPHIRALSLKDPRLTSLIQSELKPRVIFVVGCRQMLPDSIYKFPPQGTFALHDSLLPHYRGFAPLNWSILNGDKETGVSLFRLTEAVDAGEVMGQERISIGPDETAGEVYQKVCESTVSLIKKHFRPISQGTAHGVAQPSGPVTFSCARSPEDGLIDWSQSTRSIYNQIRALSRPYPGAFTYSGTRKLIIWKAALPAETPDFAGRIAGRIVAIRKDGVDVLTGDGVLTLKEAQFEGENPRELSEIFRSVRAKLGLDVNELLTRIHQLEQQLAGRSSP